MAGYVYPKALSLGALLLSTSYFWVELTELVGASAIVTGYVFSLYAWYYWECSTYHYRQPSMFKVGKRFTGKTLPSYPNGWFVVCRSAELKAKGVKYIDQSGHNIALFRGEDGTAFAIDAYCPHSGANLAVGGVVKEKSCLQCPFHGWLFDGNTGNLVGGRDLKPRKMERFEYPDKIEPKEGKESLKKVCDEQVTIRKYLLQESYGYIFIWMHSDPDRVPNYAPLDITDFTQRLKFRGTSVNIVSAHVQDIVENGGDLKHFYYVHTQLLPFTELFKATWRAKWMSGDSPNLMEEMKHEHAFVTEYKERLLKRYLNDDNKKDIGIMTLDNYMVLPGCAPKFFFNATVFQVGPGLVYLFLISPFYEAVFFQHTTTKDRFHHEVYHELYTNWYMPYWSSSLMLRLEALQVANDGVVWDNKKFGIAPYYNTQIDSDRMLVEWRRWFFRFYEGCAEREAAMSQYTW
jgi:cholesterol 7-dehydrogenase